MSPRSALLALSIVLTACGTVAPPGPDAGLEDDAGSEPVDAGKPDAGTPDAGTPDSGTPDSGTPDAGTPDAGEPCTASGIPGRCIDVSECVDTRTPTSGLCPGPANIQCCTPRTAVACDWNARLQPNAGLSEGPGDGGCPGGMLRVSTFCVDQYEASLLEVLPDAGVRPWSPYFNPGATRVRAVSLAGAIPQGFINGLQAAAACAEAGKRLCTDLEWLRACQGPGNTTYPYGNTRQAGVCNDARAVHPAIELYGTSASWIYSHIDSPCLNQLDGGLAPTGTHSGCVTAEGLFDMMGNLHEWTADPNGTFRGGFYVDTVLNGNGCLYVTTAHTTSHWDYSTGFRCCL
jgi:formylglycine-generating enzyme